MKSLLALVACSLAAAGLVPAASAAPALPDAPGPGLQCMDVYSETHLLGPYWLVRRNSCSAQVYECPDGYDPPAPPCREANVLEPQAPALDFPACAPALVGNVCVSPYWPGCAVWVEWTALPAQPTCIYGTDELATSAAGPTVDCMPVYSRTDVGTLSIVRRSSCSFPEVYQCPYPGAPIATCSALLQAQERAAAGPDVQCMDVYSETHLVGPYWLVRRDSCSAQVYECPEGASPPGPPCQEAQLLRLEASAACYSIYQRTDVGTLSIVRTSSCAVPMAYTCPYEGAPLHECENVLSLQAAAEQPSVGLPPVYCMPYERELALTDEVQVVQGGCGSYVRLCDQRVDPTDTRTVDPSCLGVVDVATLDALPDADQRVCHRSGQGELQSVYCVDPASTDCTVYVQQITGQGSSWTCYPSGEHGSDW